MNAEDVKIAVIRMEGTNCEDESTRAWSILGAKAEKVHINQLTGKSEDKRCLEDYHALFFPGGFSAGDYIRAGAIFAARLKYTLGRELRDFVESEKPVIGVCNGFQILVEMGLLPGFEDTMTHTPEAVLMTNDSDRFECRPTFLKHSNRGKCVFTSKLKSDEVLMIPSAHAEGKLMFPGEREEELLDRLFENDQVVFRYVDPQGNEAGYPWNPNGSKRNIAGICNTAGNVFGLMPHPERVLESHTHNNWTRMDSVWRTAGRGDGLTIFESAIEYIKRKV